MDGMLYSPLSLKEMCCGQIRYDISSIDKGMESKVIEKFISDEFGSASNNSLPIIQEAMSKY